MNTTNGETALWVNIRPALKTNETIITLMLVNNLDRGDKKPWDKEYNQVLIHQPEIRIVFTEGTAFPEPTGLPQREECSSEQEYEVRLDEFRYASRSQKGRGHLCSVTWGEFDPQRMSSAQKQDLLVTYSSDGPEENLAQLPPFFWTDGQHPALASVKDRFREPDIRTEYLPMIVLPAPEMDPKDQRYWEECPTAETLSTAFTPTEMESQLLPLVKGYEKWIQGELAAAPSSVVQKAQAALERIDDGMAILLADDAAREAFNIANRAIHLSNQWRNPNWDFRWRKFQLAFALASVESLTNVDSPNRDALDLLWVATGGGKTEAYLLLMAYAIVHRQLQFKHGQSQGEWHGVDVITRYTLRLLTIQQSRRTLGTVWPWNTCVTRAGVPMPMPTTGGSPSRINRFLLVCGSERVSRPTNSVGKADRFVGRIRQREQMLSECFDTVTGSRIHNSLNSRNPLKSSPVLHAILTWPTQPIQPSRPQSTPFTGCAIPVASLIKTSFPFANQPDVNSASVQPHQRDMVSFP